MAFVTIHILYIHTNIYIYMYIGKPINTYVTHIHTRMFLYIYTRTIYYTYDPCPRGCTGQGESWAVQNHGL